MKTTGKTNHPKPPKFDAEGYQTNLTALNGAALPALGQLTAKPANWGGARKGAGRKSSGRQAVLIRLTPKTLRILRSTAQKQGKSLSDIVEERLASA